LKLLGGITDIFFVFVIAEFGATVCLLENNQSDSKPSPALTWAWRPWTTLSNIGSVDLIIKSASVPVLSMRAFIQG
jgi:hypothetical protein